MIALRNLACVILAAGEGTRMNSELPKVLHPIGGVPMLEYILKTVEALGIEQRVVVAGYQKNQVEAWVGSRARVIEQTDRRGSGHAVLQAQKALDSVTGPLLVLYGDAPLIRRESLEGLLRTFEEAGAQAAILTAFRKDPQGYGRIVRDAEGGIRRIVEEKHASSSEREIREINGGACCFEKDILFDSLKALKPHPGNGEVYLTDVIESIARKGRVVGYTIPDAYEAMGINSRKELAVAEEVLNKRSLEYWMSQGITIRDPRTTHIGPEVRLDRDTVILSHTVIDGPARIGKKCRIGPFAHLREDVMLGDEVIIGNFVELVRCRIGNRSRVKHLAYLGDCEVGADVNIGAGTITANFDGKSKYKTVIEEGAQIGSGTIFVAPVRVGKGARTGAGAVVTKGHDVPGGETVVGIPARPMIREGNPR